MRHELPGSILEADPRLVAELTRLVDQAKADPQTASFVISLAGVDAVETRVSALQLGGR